MISAGPSRLLDHLFSRNLFFQDALAEVVVSVLLPLNEGTHLLVKGEVEVVTAEGGRRKVASSLYQLGQETFSGDMEINLPTRHGFEKIQLFFSPPVSSPVGEVMRDPEQIQLEMRVKKCSSRLWGAYCSAPILDAITAGLTFLLLTVMTYGVGIPILWGMGISFPLSVIAMLADRKLSNFPLASIQELVSLLVKLKDASFSASCIDELPDKRLREQVLDVLKGEDRVYGAQVEKGMRERSK